MSCTVSATIGAALVGGVDYYLDRSLGKAAIVAAVAGIFIYFVCQPTSANPSS